MIYYGGSIVAFDAQQKKINDILSGDFKYVIPRYQRKYVWQEKQWRELLEDIKYCLEVDASKDDAPTDWTHFLGSFVFEKQENSNRWSTAPHNYYYYALRNMRSIQ